MFIALIIVIGLIYLAFSFIQADFNTLNWHWITRIFFVAAVLGGFGTIIKNTYGKTK